MIGQQVHRREAGLNEIGRTPGKVVCLLADRECLPAQREEQCGNLLRAIRIRIGSDCFKIVEIQISTRCSDRFKN
jgi:hypothetical protein